MRIVLMLIGLLLLAGGIWVLAGPGTYTATDTALKVGDFAINTARQKPIPNWVGIAGIVVGVLLLIGGLARGRK